MMAKLPRTGFDFVITVAFVVAAVFAAISIFNYAAAVVIYYTQFEPPEITLTDIANWAGILAGLFALAYLVMALIQEWRIRRGRKRE